MSQVGVIKQCLDTFCSSSGQRVSSEKTRIFFSRNVNHVIREDISREFNFSRTNNLGKYLGVPLIHSRTTTSTYKAILEKTVSRLSSWKASSLSFAGRLCSGTLKQGKEKKYKRMGAF